MNNTEDRSSESIEHIKIKKFFYDNLPLFNPIKKIEQEYRIGDQIIDLFVEFENSKKIAIEIQHSKIYKKDLLNRTRNYNQKGIFVLWILNGNGPYYYRIPKNEQGVITSSSERELHKMYQERVYYINMAKERIIAPIYAVHFASYYEKRETKYGTIRYKESTIKRSVVWNPIYSLRLHTFRNKGFRLARFTDQNLRLKCQNDLIQLLNAFVAYQCKPSSLPKIPGLPLSFIIKKYSKIYGIFLLFDILRHLKFLKGQDIKYFLSNELRFQKYLLT
ncbi:MAG: competence protein CoiA family protein [Candidatus Hermodarchaeota archaeon]